MIEFIIICGMVFGALLISASIIEEFGKRSRNPDRWRKVAQILTAIALIHFAAMWFALDCPLTWWTVPVFIAMLAVGIYYVTVLLSKKFGFKSERSRGTGYMLAEASLVCFAGLWLALAAPLTWEIIVVALVIVASAAYRLVVFLRSRLPKE